MKKIITIIAASLIFSCANSELQKHTTYNNGWYEWNNNLEQDISKDSISVVIQVIDKNDSKKIMFSKMQYGCQKFDLSHGMNFFKFKKGVSKNQIRVSSVGYLSLETKPFVASNSLTVRFFLAEDDRNLVNCEGAKHKQ